MELGVCQQAVEQIVLPALELHDGGGRLGVAADGLVQLLPVAAQGDGVHEDVLRRHEGQLLV